MDLSELQVFLTVAREGSFSRAAERLYRTQPAVSLTIRKLEDGLGQPLFVRGARPVRMTDAGTLLRDYAERLINLRDEVQRCPAVPTAPNTAPIIAMSTFAFSVMIMALFPPNSKRARPNRALTV